MIGSFVYEGFIANFSLLKILETFKKTSFMHQCNIVFEMLAP